MPNPLSGILGGFGNLLGNMAAGGNPASQQLQWQQQGYGALSQQMGPGDAALANQPGMDPNLAALAMSRPDVYENLIKQQIFQQQLNNPSFNKAIYGTSPEGQKEQFGRTEGQPVELPGGVKIPTYFNGPNLQYGIPGGGSGAGQTSAPPTAQRGTPAPIATGGQGGLGGSQSGIQSNPLAPIQPLIDQSMEMSKNLEVAKAVGQEQGTKQSNIDTTVDQINRSIAKAEELAGDQEGMYWGTGYMANFGLGKMQGTHTYKWTQGLEQLKNQLTLDVLPTLTQKGRSSPALFEMLQKSTAGNELDPGNPDFQDNLKETIGTLRQMRADLQKGAKVPVTQEPAPSAYNSPADVRAAIKAGKLKVGQSFQTNDGRTLIAR